MNQERYTTLKTEKSKKLISIILVLSIATIAFPSYAYEKLTKSEVMSIADKIGEEYHICPEFLVSIDFKESSYNPYTEYEGCVGLMQICPSWHKERMKRLGVKDLMDPYDNMLVAADYLMELFKEYEDVCMVLEVYNGDSRADSYWNGNAGFSEYEIDIIEMSEELERENEK